MVRKILVLLFFFAMSCNAYADIDYINIKKITKDKELISYFEYLKKNLPYYDHWTMGWNYDIPKEEIILKLKYIYKKFSESDKNEELFLLLGDIAHYLYNLDAGDENDNYNKITVDNYDKAIKMTPQDYRGFWFLGKHCSQIPGEYLIKGIDNFRIAENLNKDKKPAKFWIDYAYNAILVAMPSHYFYSYDKAKNISKNVKEPYERDKIIISLDKDKEYDNTDIWRVNRMNGNTFFTSRPLGMRFILSEEEGDAYGLQIFDYRNNSGAFLIHPARIKNKDGKEIGYTILVLAKAVDDKINLQDFTDNDSSISKAKNKKKIHFSEKYDKIISYEIIDKDQYGDIGGAHLYFITVEREYPQYAGLILEIPNIPDMNGETTSYFRLKPQSDRFTGKIIYTIILDTCEDIHDESLTVFKDFFENKLVIE
ncbi:MAG: hypothetical protein FWG57_03795 [Endomicrobia bacterium]|nr:hypothetical protein [Endomicrobiia bacterium]